MIKYSWILGLAVVCASCSSNNVPANDPDVSQWMVTYEDSLKTLGEKPDQFEEVKKVSERYANGLVSYYEEHPESEKAPECLDKAHMLLTGAGKTKEAVKWAELVVEKYPSYVNRPMVLESVASAYDSSIHPRDSVKVRRYYELLLKENPSMDAEKREGIERRLSMNNVPLDRYIELMILQEAENQ